MPETRARDSQGHHIQAHHIQGRDIVAENQKSSRRIRRYFVSITVANAFISIVALTILGIFFGFVTQLVTVTSLYSKVTSAADQLRIDNDPLLGPAARPPFDTLKSDVSLLRLAVQTVERHGVKVTTSSIFAHSLSLIDRGLGQLEEERFSQSGQASVQTGARMITAASIASTDAELAPSNFLEQFGYWGLAFGVFALVGVSYLSMLILAAVNGVLRWNADVIRQAQDISVRTDVSVKSVPYTKLFPGAELLAAQSALISGEFTRQVKEQRALVTSNRKLAKKLSATIKEMDASRDEFRRGARLAAVGNIAGSVSHEINNPVTGVMGYLAFVRKRNRDESLKIYLDKAMREVERIGRIAKSLLVFSRRSAQPVLTPFDIGPSIDNVKTLVEIPLHEASVSLSVHVPTGLPPVRGRVDEFQQCLLNLLLNARDAVKDSPQKLITVRVKKKLGEIHVVVTDSGTGVSEKAQEHLFEPFFTTKTAGQGSGLGLTVTHELMQRMGGNVVFDASHSPGARFVLTLPIFDETTPASLEPAGAVTDQSTPAATATEENERKD